MSCLFERRIEALRADHEQFICALLAERDVLLAARQTQMPQPQQVAGPHLDAWELAALRAEQLAWRQEKVKYEQEREAWAVERAELGQERATMEAERVQWRQTIARLTQDRETILQEHEGDRTAMQSLQVELASLRHKLQVSGNSRGTSQGQLASRNALVLAMETQTQQLEAARSSASEQASASTQVSSHALSW